MSSDLRDRLAAGAGDRGVTLGPGQLDRLADYVALLIRWRKVYNLVGDRGARRLVDRHLLDSLAAAPCVTGERLLDIGSGAGLPGLPIAIARPELQVVLLDPNAKRTRFLTTALAELGTENVEVVRSRAEDYRPATRFDTVIARAVAPLDALCRMADPLLSAAGRLLALKGKLSPDERELGADARFRIVDEVETAVADGTGARYIVCLTRTADPDHTVPR